MEAVALSALNVQNFLPVTGSLPSLHPSIPMTAPYLYDLSCSSSAMFNVTHPCSLTCTRQGGILVRVVSCAMYM